MHNDVEIKRLPSGFTSEFICIENFDVKNDLFEIRAGDSNDVSPILYNIIYAEFCPFFNCETMMSKLSLRFASLDCS